MPMKVSDLEIEVNLKFSFTDKREHQFYKNLLENFNPTKAAEGKSDVTERS
jgi:hypothetical protein